MFVISGRNVNDVFIEGLWALKVAGKAEDTRNGKVLALAEPAMSVYRNPAERVLYHDKRNANPFFHLMECVWMMAGSDDLAFVERYNSNMASYSDDGKTIYGAYGNRWRTQFEVDQLEYIVRMLRQDPTSRRIVLTMWDPTTDLDSDSKDIPCNTQVYFRVVRGMLDMTITCRSNDAIWGAYGANAVHFSFLHEYIARASGIPQGTMYQLSNNLHIYEQHRGLLDAPAAPDPNPYELMNVLPLFSSSITGSQFLMECEVCVKGEKVEFETEFFNEVVAPAIAAWDLHKRGNTREAIDYLIVNTPSDWNTAMLLWLRRVVDKVQGRLV